MELEKHEEEPKASSEEARSLKKVINHDWPDGLCIFFVCLRVSEGVGVYGYHSRLRNHLFCHDANGRTSQKSTKKHDFVVYNVYTKKDRLHESFDNPHILVPCNLCSASVQFPKTGRRADGRAWRAGSEHQTEKVV